MVCPAIGLYVGIIAPHNKSFAYRYALRLAAHSALMVIELGAYGLVGGLMHRIFKKSTYLSLITAMAAGRAALGGAAYVMMRFFGFNINPMLYVQGAIVTGLPGIALQLVLVPVLVYMIERGTVYERPGDSNGKA